MDIEATFQKFNGDFFKFRYVKNKLSPRKDMHAFLLLDAILPPGRGPQDMVSAGDHDIIWLGVDVAALAKVITEDQVRDLVRCGVGYDSGNDSLAMYVTG